MSWPETKIILDAIVANGLGGNNGAVIMIPMTENKYGYNLRLYDIDGVTPLPDVKINGVTDPNTEIRTNADGVAKFISSSPSHSISFTEFPSGYQYADIFTSRTIRGYINDMTEVIVAPDVSEFAGFNVTLLDNTGAPVTNKTVTCTTNSKSYTTNSSGQIPQTIYSSSTSLAFTWSGQSTSTSGSLRITTTTNYSATVSGGSLGSVSSLTSANATTSSSNAYDITVSASVGSYLTIGTRQYVITQVDSSIVYAVLRYWEEDTVFNYELSTDYVGSDIANKCATWYSSNVPSIWRNNATTTVRTEGVTAACFIPTYNQVNGGWSYFNSGSQRIFTNSSGKTNYWWTSTESTSSHVWYVGNGGAFLDTVPNASGLAFRPALALKRSLF